MPSPTTASHASIGRALLLAGAAAASLAAPSLPAAAAPAMLPDRLLHCMIGRMTNIDPKKNQTNADIVYEGQHRFDLFLPGIAVRTGPPPDAIAPAEPVDPRTKIVADPDGLTAKFPPRFDRVVDYWPERVEMTTTIDDPLVNLIILNPIDVAHGTARLFMTQATDVATFDLAHVYGGDCTIEAPTR